MLDQLVEIVKKANEAEEPLAIVGGNSKAFLGRDLSHLPVLKTTSLDQVVNYDPAELVIQVEAGMKISTLNALLAKEHQMLGFEPSTFDGNATIGGAIAAASSGSRRPFCGSARDFVLGLDVLDGQGNVLEYGGQVMKNVAGYDVSRLMAGAFGCLGVITEVSLKILPMPELEQTLARICTREEAMIAMQALAKKPELSAAAWFNDKLIVRFSGSEDSVKKIAATFGGEPYPNDFWTSVDNLSLIADDTDIWRVSCARHSDLLVNESCLIDWSGAQRWIKNPRQDLWAIETDANISLIKTSDSGKQRFKPLPAYIEQLHQRIKQVFDPKGIFNPQKMYSAF